jgi:FtsP/CotA-like multicopper oxidase with cupredoxin domain
VTRILVLVALLVGVVLLVARPRGGPEQAASAQPAGTAAGSGGGQVRRYFVAADEVVWDYAPSGRNQISGEPYNEFERFVAVPGRGVIGNKYKKTIYREYTDATFATLEPRPAEWEHLGILGPLIRAEVGDTIRVVFKNNGKHPFSMHPHGVFYEKASEGAQYTDGTSMNRGATPPGGTHTYEWLVPERAGPTEHEASSAMWMYHSHLEEERDVNAGLIGPMIITRRGAAKADGSPRDVDREIVVGFLEMDENNSWHFDESIQLSPEPKTVRKTEIFSEPDYLVNLKENLNGYIYGHLPPPTMKTGERVRWYLFGSTNFEVHAPHWHGNTVVANHMRTDVVGLLPMGMLVADMVPDAGGTWLFHCHTGPHLRAGMSGKYVVQDGTAAAATPTGGGN